MTNHATGYDKGFAEAAAPRDAEITKLKEQLRVINEQLDIERDDAQLHFKRAERMTAHLRDRLAIASFNGMRSNGYDNTRDVVAAEAYKDADALLAARGKGLFVELEEFCRLVAAGPDFHLNEYTRTLQEKARELLKQIGPA